MLWKQQCDSTQGIEIVVTKGDNSTQKCKQENTLKPEKVKTEAPLEKEERASSPKVVRPQREPNVFTEMHHTYPKIYNMVEKTRSLSE